MENRTKNDEPRSGYPAREARSCCACSRRKQTGTAGYQAPEVIHRGEYGPASDVWALGCLLYAMITVTLPFAVEERKNGQRTVNRTIDYDLLELDTVQASDACKNLLSCMLRKDV